jgi:RNA polymerase sigma-70 factor (ECF subfamily)
MTSRDDAQLVRLCRQGDAAAYGELIDRYQKPLFNTALRMTGDHEEARDITQSAFVKAYERLDSFNPEFKFFSWIYRILLNESLNTLKQRRQNADIDPDQLAHNRTPEGEYEAQKLSAEIDAALRSLALEYRVVIVLRHFNEMSYDEMSEILSIPAKTVKSRLYTARQNLAAILERMGVVSL